MKVLLKALLILRSKGQGMVRDHLRVNQRSMEGQGSPESQRKVKGGSGITWESMNGQGRVRDHIRVNEWSREDQGSPDRQREVKGGSGSPESQRKVRGRSGIT